MEKRFVYYIGFGFIIIALLIAGSVIFTANQNRASPTPLSPEVAISVPSTPVLKQTDNGVSISYDLRASHLSEVNLDLITVEVLDKESGKTLEVLDGELLRKATHSGADSLSSDKKHLGGSENSSFPVISVVLKTDSEAVPRVLTHRLTFVNPEKAALPFTITGGETAVPAGNVSPE